AEKRLGSRRLVIAVAGRAAAPPCRRGLLLAASQATPSCREAARLAATGHRGGGLSGRAAMSARPLIGGVASDAFVPRSGSAHGDWSSRWRVERPRRHVGAASYWRRRKRRLRAEERLGSRRLVIAVAGRAAAPPCRRGLLLAASQATPSCREAARLA